MEQIIDSLNAGTITAAVVALLSLIQISPIKVNPWDTIFGWIGKKVNRGMDDRMRELERQISDMWIQSHRQSILTFAREARNEITHSADEWAQILSLADEYEIYCQQHTVSNGVVKADTEYIRNLYQELSRDHRI